MHTLMPETRQTNGNGSPRMQLELTVRNHPGVMSHICGLFSRRAFNVEGILCMPIGKGEQSRIYLLVHEDQRVDQMIKQVRKLEDVLDVQRRDADLEVFAKLEDFFRSGRQKTEDRRQKTGDRRQKTEDRRQKTEDRRQNEEIS